MSPLRQAITRFDSVQISKVVAVSRTESVQFGSRELQQLVDVAPFDDLMHDLKVDRRITVAQPIAGVADITPRNVWVPMIKGVIEPQRLARGFAQDKNEIAQSIDLNGFHFVKAAAADGILCALAIKLDVPKARNETVLTPHG